MFTISAFNNIPLEQRETMSPQFIRTSPSDIEDCVQWKVDQCVAGSITDCTNYFTLKLKCFVNI